MWTQCFNIANLEGWLQNLPNHIPSGKKDPYTSSMRKAGRLVSALTGTALSRETQQITDLTSAQLYDKNAGKNSDLGDRLIFLCKLFNVSSNDELETVLLLFLEGLNENNDFYIGLAKFWYKVSEIYPLSRLANNIPAAYLFSYFSVDNNNYTPLDDLLQNATVSLDPLDVNDLKTLTISSGAMQKVDSLLTAISGYTTRSAREEMLNALNLIFAFDKQAVIDKLYNPITNPQDNSRLKSILGYYQQKFTFSKLLYGDFSPATTNNHILLSPVILYGPPGTGKTWEMQHRYIDSYSDDDRFVTTFHQSFSYEEFVEGLKASSVSGSINYSIEPGIFYRACNRAAVLAGYKDLDECINDIKTQRETKIANAPSVLLCIDEINRANVSAVFGDLISLIETSKRLGAGENEMTAILPYSKKKFGVPANLLIVGTMNTADRSIQLLDSALRRRFEFIELLPKLDKVGYAPAQEILKNINLNICAILNKDHQIGHSYFIGIKNDKDIVRVMMTQVVPLLEEYFYNNTEKIKVVLGEANRDFDCIYIKDDDVTKAYKIAVGDTDKQFYKLNPKYLASTISDDTANEFVNNLRKHLIGAV